MTECIFTDREKINFDENRFWWIQKKKIFGEEKHWKILVVFEPIRQIRQIFTLKLMLQSGKHGLYVFIKVCMTNEVQIDRELTAFLMFLFKMSLLITINRYH